MSVLITGCLVLIGFEIHGISMGLSVRGSVAESCKDGYHFIRLNLHREPAVGTCDLHFQVPLLQQESAFNLDTGTRCAVVSSSSILLNSGCGEDIEAHDLVFRANWAPVEGYENDVGTRTTLYSLNSHNHRRARLESVPDSPKDVAAAPNRSSVCQANASIMMFGDEWISSDDELGLSNIFNQHDGCVHPPHFNFKSINLAENFGGNFGSSRKLFNDWHNQTTGRPNAEGRGCSGNGIVVPTSGWHLVQLSLAFCDHVSLFGFQQEPTAKKYKYYDVDVAADEDDRMRREGGGCHNLTVERAFYRYLQGMGDPTVCYHKR